MTLFFFTTTTMHFFPKGHHDTCLLFSYNITTEFIVNIIMIIKLRQNLVSDDYQKEGEIFMLELI